MERVGEKSTGFELKETAVKLPVVGRIVRWMERTGLDIEEGMHSRVVLEIVFAKQV